MGQILTVEMSYYIIFFLFLKICRIFNRNRPQNLKSSYTDMFVPLGKSRLTINGADHVVDLFATD